MRAVRDIDLHQEIRALGGQPHGGAAEGLDEDDAALWEPASLDDNAPFYAWVAAETKVTRHIRHYLVNECGLPKQCVTSMGYWRLGKADS